MICKFCCRSNNYCNCIWTELVNTEDLFITKNKNKFLNKSKIYKAKEDKLLKKNQDNIQNPDDIY